MHDHVCTFGYPSNLKIDAPSLPAKFASKPYENICYLLFLKVFTKMVTQFQVDLRQGSKGIGQLLINWCTFPTIINNITPYIDYN